MVVAVMPAMAAVPADVYAQTPSGDQMKDDKTKMEQGDETEALASAQEALPPIKVPDTERP